MSLANSQVAHVWNAQSKAEGKSSNGNFYFRGRALYSYGSHFVVGYIMPDGAALLNADGYSVSTNRHKSDALRAVSNRRKFHVAGLTDLCRDFGPVDRLARWLAEGKPAADRAGVQSSIRKVLRTYAPSLASKERLYSWSDAETDAEEAGAYLARLAGLPAATWPKLKREAEAAAKREAREVEARNRHAAEARALQLADMPPRQWRNWLAELGTQYSPDALANLRRELFRSRAIMLKAKSGKLAAKSRLETIRERIKRASFAIDHFTTDYEIRNRRRGVHLALAVVRNWRDSSPDGRKNASYAMMRDLVGAAERLEAFGRTAALKASAATLAQQAHIGMQLVSAEDARIRELERERERLEEAERIKLWLAGERVGRIYFDAESGGAAMRIAGDTLETSHGASVPLAHAIKAFRFIKLCRERGETFHRNGRTIRVGHFQVDSIDAEGNFRAGCHYFTWPEIERVAKLAGVFDSEASAEAVESSHLALHA